VGAKAKSKPTKIIILFFDHGLFENEGMDRDICLGG
jgi:hypothetical protein